MVQAAAVDHDAAAFRRIVEDAGLLRPGAPVPTEEAGAYFSHFYEPVATDRTMTWTPEYASSIVRHTFDRSSPIAQYATVPRAFVFIQRINLGLYALLGDLRATGNYRRMAEELWPFADGAPSTPLGEAEAAWLENTADLTDGGGRAPVASLRCVAEPSLHSPCRSPSSPSRRAGATTTTPTRRPRLDRRADGRHRRRRDARAGDHRARARGVAARRASRPSSSSPS